MVVSELFLYKNLLHLLVGREGGCVSDDGMAAASGYGFLVERGTSRRMRFLLAGSEERGMYLIEAVENEVGDRIDLGHHRIGLREERVCTMHQ
jgi:hypothetical protein